MKTNPENPRRRQAASFATRELKEHKEWKLLLSALRSLCAIAAILLPVLSMRAATRYVRQESHSPEPPYTNWTSAAHVIQDAVDAALAGDEIVVTNGIYTTGGRAVGTNLLVNRVAVDKPLTLRSVNGPEATIIQGYQVPSTTNGDGAIRCVYLAGGACLSGFTLTNGATRIWPWTGDYQEREYIGGGVRCEFTNAFVTNCVITCNSAFGEGGGACGGTLNNCTLTGNSSTGGGGAYGGTLNNCKLTANSALYEGGGAHGATLNNCILSGNSAEVGGGACESTLHNCVLTGNSALQYGGGACGSTLNNCTLTGNSAVGEYSSGGGAYGGALNHCTLNNCLLTDNSADEGGAFAGWGALNNCTLTGNSARVGGGVSGYCNMGGSSPPLNNCIVYFNTATSGANYLGGEFRYCCTTPLPGGQEGTGSCGIGNITNAPLFMDAAAGNYHLRPGSPCIDAGTNLSDVITNDLDGRPRPIDGNGDGVAAFDIGAYEYRELLVWQDSPNPTPPYGTWATAAHVIQDAVDAALAGDEIVVTNGIYTTGGRAVGTNLLQNRVAVDKPLTVRSVNGPEVTIIQGYQLPGTTNGDRAIRCVYLADGASLSGFMLANGATRSVSGDPTEYESSGGGAWSEPRGVLTNCILIGNSAYAQGGGVYGGMLINCTLTMNSAQVAGGVIWSTLKDCRLTCNTARYYGGGVCNGTLYDCILIGNSGLEGGGAFDGVLNNCMLSNNTARDSGGGALGGTLDDCTLVGNSALMGGGAYEAALNNCTLASNYASGEVMCLYPGGGGAMGCILNGCTLTNNTSGMCGGGALSSVLNNCTLVGNSADAAGGGACEDMMTNCTLAANSAGVGGGAYAGTLNNCALTDNTAGDGGGVYGGTVNNCTLVGNTVSGGGGGAAGSTLNKCSLTRNSAAYGGGAYAGTLNNCTLTGNSAYYGGGVSGSISMWNNDLPTLNNCMLTGNSAERGGAAYGGSLMNCTLTGNSAFEGGGAYSASEGEEFFYCDLWNCIVFFNTATNGANYLGDGEIALIHCCTTPLATWGGGWYPAVGNITNAPLFVDYASGNLRLQSNSPCINAGNNAYAPGTVDLDGQSRIVSGTVDIGAYEYQGAGSLISYAWLQQYGLPTDGSADAADLDLDGHTTWQEWRCLTDPTNALSALRLVSASPVGTNVVVTWQSIEGVSYSLERGTNLTSPFTPLATSIPGQPGRTTFTDTNAVYLAPLFYRVGVR